MKSKSKARNELERARQAKRADEAVESRRALCFGRHSLVMVPHEVPVARAMNELKRKVTLGSELGLMFCSM